MILALFVQAPVYPTADQLATLIRVLPGLAAVSVDELELALDLCPFTVLAECSSKLAGGAKEDLERVGLRVGCLPNYGPALIRTALGVEERPVEWLELTLMPTFNHYSVVSLLPASDGPIMEVLLADQSLHEHLTPIAARLRAGLDLDNPPQLRIHRAEAKLAREHVPTLRWEPEPERGLWRDGIGVGVRWRTGEEVLERELDNPTQRWLVDMIEVGLRTFDGDVAAYLQDVRRYFDD